MRHRMGGNPLSRRTGPREALLRGLATSLLEHERIETTIAKAKELRGVVEPLITLGKRGDIHARRQASAYLYKPEIVSKLFGEVASRFKDRPGGYTRIFRTRRRRGDAAEMALIELIHTEKPKKEASAKKKEAKKAAAPKKEAKKAAPEKSLPRKAEGVKAPVVKSAPMKVVKKTHVKKGSEGS